MKKNLDSFLWWMITAVIVCGFVLCSLGFIHHDPISFIIGVFFLGFVWILVSFIVEVRK